MGRFGKAESAVSRWLNCIMVEGLDVNLGRSVISCAKIVILHLGPAGNELVYRDEQMGNRLKSAVSAGEIGKERIDG